jgi:DNA polymerase-3 subunit epsilon
MSSWTDGQLAPFDLETTGINCAEDRIVSWCVARVGGGKPTATLTGFVNPGIPIPAGATAIHRITDAMVLNEEQARSAVERIADQLTQAQRLGLPIVGWNVSYDLTLLSCELNRYGLASLDQRLDRPIGPVLDGLVLDKHVSRRKGSRKLVDAAQHYGFQLSDIDAHGAEADAIAAARIVWRIGRDHTEIGRLPLAELHDLQVQWRREQQDSLRAYFDRQGIQHDGVDGRWPLALPPQMAAAS